MTLVRQIRQPWFWLVVAAALVLRAAIPAGWMPAAGQDGVRIAVCTGMEAEYLTLSSDGRLHKDAPAPQAPRDPCPYGIAMAAADVPAAPQFDAALILPETAQPLALAEAQRRIRRSLRPPARGPPAFT